MKKDIPFHWAWIILGTCFVNLFIAYSVRLGYGVVLPEMITDLGWNRTAAGTIYNAYLLTYITITPIVGILTDRFGARWVITLCCFFLGTGVFLMGTVESLWTASLFFGIAGLGATGMWAPLITLAQRWYAPRKRGMAMGILSTGYGLGFASMGIAFPLIVKIGSWRAAWYILGGAALIMTAGNLFLLKSDPERAGYRPWGERRSSSAAAAPASGVEGFRWVDLFKDRNFWIIGASYFCISYALYGITTFMVDYAKFQIGLSLEKASFLASIHGFSQIAGVLIILPLSDVLGRKRTLCISQGIIVAALCGILFFGHSWVLLYGFTGCMAVFYGVIWPGYGLCAGDYFPRRYMATVIGCWTPFYGLGAIITHWTTGRLRDITGVYDHAFLIDIAMALAALILLAMVSPQRRPAKGEA